jgi:hypothetical protein
MSVGTVSFQQSKEGPAQREDFPAVPILPGGPASFFTREIVAQAQAPG